MVHPSVRGLAVDVEYAARKLVQVKRARAAAEMLSLHRKDSDPPNGKLLAEVLEAVLREPNQELADATFSYVIGELLELLENSQGTDELQVARLEWAFAGVLHHGRPLPALHRAMAADPAFFVELVEMMHGRAEDEADPATLEQRKRRATTAYEVLHEWHGLPGKSPDGTIDIASLKQWVTGALEAFEQRGQGAVGAQFIGEVLSHSPNGSDGAWPHEAVRDVIEEIENPEVETGLEVGEYNGRGVTTRSLTEGGAREHERAARYEEWAQTTRALWPRTAAILRTIADQYRRHGRREDAETDLRNDGFW